MANRRAELHYDADGFSAKSLEEARRFLERRGIEFDVKQATDILTDDGINFCDGFGNWYHGLEEIKFYIGRRKSHNLCAQPCNAL
jgi:hypothetical protein